MDDLSTRVISFGSSIVDRLDELKPLQGLDTQGRWRAALRSRKYFSREFVKPGSGSCWGPTCGDELHELTLEGAERLGKLLVDLYICNETNGPRDKVFGYEVEYSLELQLQITKHIELFPELRDQILARAKDYAGCFVADGQLPLGKL